MTKEQLNELAEALTVLSAKSSIVKEREELKALMQDNIKSEQVRLPASDASAWSHRCLTPPPISIDRSPSCTLRIMTKSRHLSRSESGP